VFLRIHRGLPYFRGEARLSTWIYRIVANVCAQDQTRREAMVSLDDDRVSGRSTPSVSDRRFSDLELRIAWTKPSSACRELSAPHRRALPRRRAIRGARRSAAGSAGTVKTQLYRAKQQLRQVLETELK